MADNTREEDFVDHGTHWKRKTLPPRYRPLPSPDNQHLHSVIWEKVKERQGKSTALIANEIREIIQSEITKAQEQLLDELNTELIDKYYVWGNPDGSFSQDPSSNQLLDIQREAIEAKRKEIKGEK